VSRVLNERARNNGVPEGQGTRKGIMENGYCTLYRVGWIMTDVATASTSLMNVLLPVVVGGLIGIISGLVGPYCIQRAKDAAEKKRKRAEKFEELVAAVAEHRYWLAVMRFFVISGQDYWRGIGQPSPITKVQAIASTYFPEFKLLVLQLESASNQYEQWILDTGQKRVRNEPGYENLTGHGDVLTKYVDKQQEFLAELESFARREFQ
jgi:hypothetical protein